MLSQRPSGALRRGDYRERSWRPGEDWERAESGLYLPGARASSPRNGAEMIGIDLFCGAGGFSLGFHQAGWHVAAALELDVFAAMTYLCNLGGPDTVLHFADRTIEQKWQKALRSEAKRTHEAKLDPYAPGAGWIASHPEQKPVAHFYLGDIRAFSAEQVLSDLGLGRGEVGCVFGGPPCQGFSMAGQRETMDPRNSLVFEFMHFVVAAHPKTFVLENVPGMLSMSTPEGVPVIDMLARIAQDGGFMTADAFKRTLAAQSDSVGFLRSETKIAKEPRAARAGESASEQLTLLAA
jgi:DNA (cytosine-5)-methyltransferase 1